jgi:hypothetical protein
MQSLSLVCTISAAIVAAIDGANSTAVASSIVVPQAVSGAWNSTLAFDAFSVAGRRLSVY